MFLGATVYARERDEVFYFAEMLLFYLLIKFQFEYFLHICILLVLVQICHVAVATDSVTERKKKKSWFLGGLRGIQSLSDRSMNDSADAQRRQLAYSTRR